MSGEDEEQPAKSSAIGIVSTEVLQVVAGGVELTEQDDCYRNQYHEHMVVTQKRNQSLDSDSEPYVRHDGRKGLPAVWFMGDGSAEIKLRPSGTGEGRLPAWNALAQVGVGVLVSIR